ncbi:MAG: InlB B-repeat-containing protein [Clostridiaceae bacterium]
MQQQANAKPRLFVFLLAVLLILSAAFCLACAPDVQDAAPSTPSAVPDPAAEASGETPVTELSLALPDGASSGDMLLAQICCVGEADFSVETASGWTIIMRTVNEAGIGMTSFYKFIQDPAEEPGLYPFLVATGNADDEQAQVSGKILICRGIDPTNPIGTVSGETGSGTDLTVDGFETEEPAVIVTLFGISDNSVSFTAPDDPEGIQTLFNELTDGGFVLYASEQTQDSGAVETRTLTAGRSGNWASQLISFRLAPMEVTFLAGDRGSLTNAEVPALDLSATLRVALDQIPAVNPPAGYTLAGWLPKGGTECLSSEEVSQLALTSGAQFTAQYQKTTYTVRFLLGDHGTSTDRLVFSGLSYGADIRVPSVTANSGWTFEGWDVTPSATVKGNKEYVAQYAEASNFEVSFALGEHGTSGDTLVFSGLASGDTITVPDVTADEGWTFDGWDTTPVTTVTGNAVYTAQYVVTTYTVTFNLDNKGTSGDTLVFSGMAIGDSITIPEVTASSGWRFIGWDSEPSETVEGNATYTALFEVLRPK